MTSKEYAILLNYMYNNQKRLEDEIRQLKTNLRFRDIDVVDCIELALALNQLDTFKETTKQIRLLLKIGGVEK